MPKNGMTPLRELTPEVLEYCKEVDKQILKIAEESKQSKVMKDNFIEHAPLVVRYVASGNNIRTACQVSGVGKTLFYKWQKKFEDFADVLRAAQAANEVFRVAHIAKAADKDWKADAWHLERTRSETYAMRNVLDVQDSRGEDPMDRLIAYCIAQADPKVLKQLKNFEKKDDEDKEIPLIL